MKFRIYPSIAISLALIISACDNDKDVMPDPSSETLVTINGDEYSVVRAGDQVWTSVNYAGPSGVPFDDEGNKPEYGKYYSKAEVEAIPLPEGWRLPTQDDYKKLAQFYGIEIPSNGTHTENIRELISEKNWNHVVGTNTSGFNAQPAGYIYGESVPIPGDIAEFWVTEGITMSIQEAGAGLTALRMVFYQSDNSPDYKFNVRFVKDDSL